MSNDTLNVKRLKPIFIDYELDDLNLDVFEFRVYVHLSRKLGNNDQAWPSYNSIGRVCFAGTLPNASKETLRNKAIKAIKGLVAKGLIIKVVNKRNDGGNTSNHYYLEDKSNWGDK